MLLSAKSFSENILKKAWINFRYIYYQADFFEFFEIIILLKQGTNYVIISGKWTHLDHPLDPITKNKFLPKKYLIQFPESFSRLFERTDQPAHLPGLT